MGNNASGRDLVRTHHVLSKFNYRWSSLNDHSLSGCSNFVQCAEQVVHAMLLKFRFLQHPQYHLIVFWVLATGLQLQHHSILWSCDHFPTRKFNIGVSRRSQMASEWCHISHHRIHLITTTRSTETAIVKWHSHMMSWCQLPLLTESKRMSCFSSTYQKQYLCTGGLGLGIVSVLWKSLQDPLKCLSGEGVKQSSDFWIQWLLCLTLSPLQSRESGEEGISRE